MIELVKEKGETFVSAFVRIINSVLSKEPEILAQNFEKTFRFMQGYLLDNHFENCQEILESYTKSYFDTLSNKARRRPSVKKIVQVQEFFSELFSENLTEMKSSIKETALKELEKIRDEVEKIDKEIKMRKKLRNLKNDFTDDDDENNNAETLNAQYSQFFFRGQAYEKWPMTPSLFREGAIYDEYSLYQEMQHLEPDVFKNNFVFDNLALMQHYGCPTRLLDVSFNPLVSLYFASQSHRVKNEENENVETDGKVYVFDRLDFAYGNDAAVAALSKLALLTVAEKEEFVEDLKKQSLNESGPYGNVIKENDFVVNYFLEPILVKSKYLAPRIKQQAGAFAIAPLDGQKLDGFMRSICCKEILIPAGAKESILKELDQMCINEYYLFDGLEHTAGYLKTMYNPKA